MAIVITVTIMPHFPSVFTSDPAYGEWNFIKQMAYFFMSFSVIRIRYYAGWQLADASVRASGVSYRGGDEWDLCENADVYRIETGSNEKLIKAVSRTFILVLEPLDCHLAQRVHLPTSYHAQNAHWEIIRLACHDNLNGRCILAWLLSYLLFQLLLDCLVN